MDRCCGVDHLMAFEGKYGASVVTSGGCDEAPIAEYMNHLITTGIWPVGAVWGTMGALTDDNFTEDIRKRTNKLGENKVSAWKNGTLDPSTEHTMAAFKERTRQLMLRRKQQWPNEYEYWRLHRGLE